MSRYSSAPSFDAPTHAQQWPHLPPSSAPSMDAADHFSLQDLSSSRYHSGYDDMGGSPAHSRLPGLNVHDATAPLPAPPFPLMSQLPHQQLPQNPFPAQVPSLVYPPIPMSGPFSELPCQQSADEANMNLKPSKTFDPLSANARSLRRDLDREEGEVTDREGGRSLSKSSELAVGAPQTANKQNGVGMRVEISQNPTTADFSSKDSQKLVMNSSESSTRAVPDLEEGEALSSMSPTSTRDSGSPYNPLISVSVEPYDPHHPATLEMRDHPQPFGDKLRHRDAAVLAPNRSQAHCDATKLPSQLRVQAQGALLRLAPHNIRYAELVGEGINPTVLRRLYEEVGIRVGTPQRDAALAPNTTLSESEVSNSLPQPTAPQPAPTSPDLDPVRSTRVVADQKNSASEPEPVLTATATRPLPKHTDTSKPLERKEVIARMLAAKAAKTSGGPPSDADASKESPVPSNTDVGDMDNAASVVPVEEVPSKQKDSSAKEKSKAQTELARQRIEQLKKQGLMRSQLRPQPGPAFQAPHQQGDSFVPASASPATPGPSPAVIRHPLPDRPPDPESDRSARLPGLFMAASAQSSSNEKYHLSDGSRSADPTPQPRGTQRKRPRASDFDDLPVMTKKPFGREPGAADQGDRLVIDISDDEFYGDDENDVDVEISGNQALRHASSMVLSEPKMPSRENFPLSADGLGQNTSSSADSMDSASATPQSRRTMGEEDLRKKDLAIREMRKRIAELEQRKKPKPTESPTQSPHALNPPDLSLNEHRTGADGRPIDASAALAVAVPSGTSDPISVIPQTAPETRQKAENLGVASISRSAQVLGSMDSKQLERVRLRFLRKQEIEAGLPSLDAELLRSEAKLGGFRDEQERLLSEIAKGREGRQQLINELKTLDLEINGLSMDDIEAAQHKRWPESQQQMSDDVSGHPPASSAEEASLLCSPASKSPDYKDIRAAQEYVARFGSPPAPVEPPSLAASDEGTGRIAKSGPTSSEYESEGSAMDESSDSYSAGSASADQETSEEVPTPMPTNIEDLEEKGTAQEGTSCLSSENAPHPLPERPRFQGTESHADGLVDSTSQGHEPEAQELPESSDASEAYEPPEPDPNAASPYVLFSPATGQAKSADSGAQEDQSYTGRPLTGNWQGLDSDSRAFLQVGPLDNAPRTDGSERKFTPYTSPLKYFKAYRYHPRYADEVSDGYRSLTYSHNIDPMKYVCPFDAAGGVCNDRFCEFQHFRDMNLSDDKVLIQMGSLREGKTPEEADRYLAGLKQIINDMRRDSVKDFISVAREIAAYRRRFLQDPSRILPL